jgi:hypothetical protein
MDDFCWSVIPRTLSCRRLGKVPDKPLKMPQLLQFAWSSLAKIGLRLLYAPPKSLGMRLISLFG